MNSIDRVNTIIPMIITIAVLILGGYLSINELISLGEFIAFTQLLGIAAPLIGSDIKLKENIKKIGTSISGLNVYKFNYKNHPKKYIGVMAHEVQKIKPEAVETMDSGFLGVKYDQIDVEFREA